MKFNKEYVTGKVSEITLTNDGIKDIMKVLRSLENKGILRREDSSTFLHH